MFFMLNSIEHDIYHAHKCLNANNCWHLNIYGHASEGLKARKVFVFQHFCFYESVKFHAWLS